MREADHVSEAGDASDADAVAIWLASTEGRTIISRVLSNLGLPRHFDDVLVEQVEHATRLAVQRGEHIESPAAWATAVLKRRAMDLLRAPRQAQREDYDDARIAADSHDDLDERNLDASMAADVVRRAVLQQDSEPWETSAALTVMTVMFDGAVPGDGCPQPAGGARPDEAAHWVGLWYAGRRECFELDGESSEAIRARRSRCARRVRALLASVGDAQGLRGDGA